MTETLPIWLWLPLGILGVIGGWAFIGAMFGRGGRDPRY